MTTTETAGTVIATIPRPEWATTSDQMYGGIIDHDNTVRRGDLFAYMMQSDEFEQCAAGVAIARGEVSVTVYSDPVPPAEPTSVTMDLEQARDYAGAGADLVATLPAAYGAAVTA